MAPNGSPGTRDPLGHVACCREPIDPAAVLEAVRHVDAGGNVLFVGTARGTTDGVATRWLEYDAHEPLAVATLDGLRRDAINRFDLVACAVVHRLGIVPPGEASVAVATSAPHRASAFAAAEWLMAAIKRDVPIWKAEERPDGRRDWLHPESAPRPGGRA
ncbi:MAG: molybdenum cofactor biosynthesis protein MoaE [Planctomycetes bacterium]|nr:molybdenum cofactor biosynthesis protein MoaE [Planctomycetota bacterium]